MKNQTAVTLIALISILSFFMVRKLVFFNDIPLMQGMTPFYIAMFIFIILLAIWFLFQYATSSYKKKYEEILYKIINFASRVGFLGTVQALILTMKNMNENMAMALTTTLWGIIIGFLIEMIMFILENKQENSKDKIYEIGELK